MSRGSILVVCTGNICRSPVGEAILRDALAQHDIAVFSAGTHAVSGAPAAPEAQEFVARELSRDLRHAGTQLDQGTAESSDLIITMTQAHREWVAHHAPRAVRRVFTLLELHRALTLLPPEYSCATVRDLALAASRMRARAASSGDAMDIPDPYGGPPEGYESSFRTISDACGLIIPAVRTRLQLDSGARYQ